MRSTNAGVIPAETPRARIVADAIHSGEMEGLTPTLAARADAGDYIAGRIESDELVARALARYSLD